MKALHSQTQITNSLLPNLGHMRLVHYIAPYTRPTTYKPTDSEPERATEITPPDVRHEFQQHVAQVMTEMRITHRDVFSYTAARDDIGDPATASSGEMGITAEGLDTIEASADSVLGNDMREAVNASMREMGISAHGLGPIKGSTDEWREFGQYTFPSGPYNHMTNRGPYKNCMFTCPMPQRPERRSEQARQTSETRNSERSAKRRRVTFAEVLETSSSEQAPQKDLSKSEGEKKVD